jgi:MFS family permease
MSDVTPEAPGHNKLLHHIISLSDDKKITCSADSRLSNPKTEPCQLEVASQTNDGEPTTYPEGGWAAWSVVLGSWMACFGTMGLMNSLGIFQAYLEDNELKHLSSSKIAWIFGIYSFLAFFCGIQVGPIFDAKGPRVLIICGAIGTVLFLVLLGFCTMYWHFLLVFGIIGGVSLSLTFNPAISIIAHYFNRRRGLATGIASSGASFGGLIFPLLFQRVASKLGFAWATRVIALLNLVTFGIAILLIRPRFKPKASTFGAIFPDVSIFGNVSLMLASMGMFFMEWGLFVPITYLTSYALSQGISPQFSFLLLSLINVGAIFGRWIPGYCADRIGRFNTFIITIFGCLLFTACLWMPAKSSKPITTVFALLFGFFSGSNVSLAPVCIGQLCKLEAYGRYHATAYAIVSIRYDKTFDTKITSYHNFLIYANTSSSTLTGIPIAGEILTRCNGEYWGLILFTILSYAASLVCLLAAKLYNCGWTGYKEKF